MHSLQAVSVQFVLCIGLFLTHSAAMAEDWRPLFNDEDLSGWVNVNGASGTWVVRENAIVCSGHPKGFIRTTRMYENFILEYESRHLTAENSVRVMIHADALPQVGAYLPRSVAIKATDGERGSILGIQGCAIEPLTEPVKRHEPSATPSQKRAKATGQWNHCRLTSRDGNVELAVNGKVVTHATGASLVKGYIGLESTAAEVQFRNLRIAESPSSNPSPEKVAEADAGFTSIFDGLTFNGWKYEDHLRERWQIVNNWISLCEEQPPRRGKDCNLWTEQEYQDFLLIVDWRLTRKPVLKQMNDFAEDGLIKRDDKGGRVTHEIWHSGDSGIYLRGNSRPQVNIWSQPMGSGDINSYHKDTKLSQEIRRACVPKLNADKPPQQWNRFVITMRGDRVTVVLNNELVIDDAQLPEVPANGPLALQNHGDPIQFRNLFIKTLPRPAGND